MSRQDAANFAGAIKFPYANAANDLFKKEDVQVLAQAVDQHEHSAGKGLQVGNAGLADGSVSSIKIQDGSVTTAKLALPLDGLGYTRFTTQAGAFPAASQGLELYYPDPSTGAVIQAYDRGASQYRPVRLIGSIVYMMGGGQGSNLISYDGANFVVPALATVTRLAVGGYDAGPTWGASFGGNPIASGRFFQRGNGSFHCWDAGDFTFSTVHNSASTLVQRDGSGQIAVAGLYMPVAAVGGGPTHVMGQGGDGLAHWYSASAIGPPLNAAALDFVGAVASGSQGGGATSTLTYSATENDLGVTNSSGNVTVPRAGQYAVALTCDWANGGGNTNDTVDLRLKANGGDIVVDSHVASAQGQPGRWAVVWKGFLAAGTVLSATIKNSFDNGSFGGGSSTLLVSFVPTAANP